MALSVQGVRLIVLSLLPVAGVLAQGYRITTFAGAAAPVNVPGTSAPISGVVAVAADPQGNIFFSTGSVILRMDAATRILTLVAGNGTYGPGNAPDGPATDAEISAYAIAVDSISQVYFVDHGARVRKVSNGVITTVAGNGLNFYGGDNGPATSASLNAASAIALDSSGNLYIADLLNRRIRKVSNGIITTVAGNGQTGSIGDNGPATSAQLNAPQGVAVDGQGNIYIADFDRVRRVSNGIITTFAGDGTYGFAGDGGPAVNAQFRSPKKVAVDSSGNLYIADYQNFRIRKVSQGIVTTVAGNGMQGFSGDGGPATAAPLDYVDAIALDAAGTLYIGSRFGIRAVSGGVITTAAGNGQSDRFTGDGGPASDAMLSSPSGLILDGPDLYLSDSANQRIRKISGGTIGTIAGAGPSTQGFADGPALSALFSGPVGLAFDSSHNLYIADHVNNRIRMLSNGTVSSIAGTGAAGLSNDNVLGDGGAATAAYLSDPTGVAVDSAGNVYIADSSHHRIRKISGGVITTFSGNGQAGFGGDGGPPAAALLSAPSAITIDSRGNLYIADTGNHRIRMVSNGVITTVAGNGTLGFSGDNGSATAASLNRPFALDVDSQGSIYIADWGNQRIRKVTDGIITTIAGKGSKGFSGDNGPASEAELSSPAGVAVDAAGNVYVSDSGNQRIRLLTPGTPIVTAPKPVIQAVVNAVDYSAMAAPGSWIAIFGANLSPATTVLTSLPLQTQLSGVSVTMSGTSLALRYVSPTQINALLPFGPGGDFQFVVSTRDGKSEPFPLSLSKSAPSVYTLNASGTGPAFVFDGNFQRPSVIGTAPLILYASGLGPVDPVADASAGGSTTEPFNRVIRPISVKIGGQPAQVLYAGLAPNLPGVYQLNIVPPAGPLADNSLVVAEVNPPIVNINDYYPPVSSGATILPVAHVSNTANVTGEIVSRYPVNGSSLTFSPLVTIGAFETAFDILPGAQPFKVIAACANGSATISFDPGAGTWQASLTVPATATRSYDFSAVRNENGTLPQVTDFLNDGHPFPGYIIPSSRIDPVAKQSLVSLPPSDSATTALNSTYSAQGTIPASGHVVIDSANLSNLTQFGGFAIAPSPNRDRPVRRTGCTLTVDGSLISSVLATFK